MRFYTTSSSAWDAILSALSYATESIYLEMYIFSDDTTETHNFMQTLIDRAHAGVQIVLILDAFGSSDLSNKSIETLRAAGIEVRFFRHWIHRTHRKTIVIDGRIAFVGGVNIVKHAQAWNDLQIRVTGPLVARLLKVFTRTYKLSGGTQTLRVPRAYLSRKHRVRMWVLEHTPRARQRTLRTYYEKKFREATTKLVLVTPYFIPRTWLLRAMRSAIAKGVAIDLLIPEKTDSAFLDTINRHYAAEVARLGVKVYITPGTNHAKAALIDGCEGLIGSANIDVLSFDNNSELGIFFTDEVAVARLAEVLNTWKASATVFDPRERRLAWYYVPIIILLKLLRPFL